MTQDQFIAQFKTGDFNGLWGAVENHISGEINAVRNSLTVEIAARDKQIAVLKLEGDTLKQKAAALESRVAELLKPAPVNVTGSTLNLPPVP